MPLPYKTLKPIFLKNHPDYNEVWLQEVIAADPAILGLGPLTLKDRERTHIGAGRLDMLLQGEDGSDRYEVEIQLRASDESHIIRTIEYWDRERKVYPQYEHTAVILAEDITSRFLNVISLFNGHIPIVAIQVTAVETGESIGLIFTKVLDTVKLGLLDEDEQVSETTDRDYWLTTKSTPEMVEVADQVLALCKTFAPALTQSYKKNYIGFRLNNHPFNFALCKPRNKNTHLEVSLPQSEETDKELETEGLDILSYNRHFELYRISLKPSDIEPHKDFLTQFLKRAFDERQ
jgi:predicted transport protein